MSSRALVSRRADGARLIGRGPAARQQRLIYVIPVLRPVPLFCAETFARIAAERKWVIVVWLLTAFITLPALVIILVGVL